MARGEDDILIPQGAVEFPAPFLPREFPEFPLVELCQGSLDFDWFRGDEDYLNPERRLRVREDFEKIGMLNAGVLHAVPKGLFWRERDDRPRGRFRRKHVAKIQLKLLAENIPAVKLRHYARIFLAFVGGRGKKINQGAILLPYYVNYYRRLERMKVIGAPVHHFVAAFLISRIKVTLGRFLNFNAFQQGVHGLLLPDSVFLSPCPRIFI